ncbi:MAG: hypothetical protein MUC94_16450 [bacterium]|nr:hypothetical protein [bacterium]
MDIGIFKLITFLIGIGAIYPIHKPADDPTKFSLAVQMGGSDCDVYGGYLKTMDYLFTPALKSHKYTTSLSIGTMRCKKFKNYGPTSFSEPSLEKYNVFYVMLQRDVYYQYFGYKLGTIYINAKWPYSDWDDSPPTHFFPILGLKVGNMKKLYLTADFMSEPVLSSYFDVFENAALGLTYNLGKNFSKIWIGVVYILDSEGDEIKPGWTVKSDINLAKQLNLQVSGIYSNENKGAGFQLGIAKTF